MNITELNTLNKKEISHIARSLYTFYLRPQAEQNHCIIDLTSITSYLFTSSENFKTVANFEIAVQVLEELEKYSLIKRTSEDSPWQGATYTLPLFVAEINNLPAPPFAMKLSWRPSASFSQACLLVGLTDSSFTETDLKAFTRYWAGRNETRNQVSWERAFAQRLLKGHEPTVRRARDKEESKDQEILQPVAPKTDEQLHEMALKAQKELMDVFK